MTVMCTIKKPAKLNIFGIGVNKITINDRDTNFEILFQKGMGKPLIQNIFEILKSELRDQIEWISILPLDNFSIFINYFPYQKGENILLLYMYEKDNSEIYSQLYLHSRQIKSLILSDNPLSKMGEICMETIKVPRITGVKAVYILASSGIPLFSKTSNEIINLADSQLVGGLITALFNFSQHLIGKDSGGQLKEINFGNQSFYTITKNGVIFVFYVDKITPLLERYMYILADEFLGHFSELVREFDGNITPFMTFDCNIDEYLVI